VHGDEGLVFIPGGVAHVGSTIAEVESCVEEWADRLADPAYRRDVFREWLMKEVPRHEVALDDFEIGRFPVTNARYARFLAAGEDGGTPPESIALGEPGDHPVWGVAYEDAERYAAAHGCRLPSEAEWERAARGPDGLRYPFGDTFDARCCNTLEAAIGTTTAVDRYAAHASGFGVCDMAGNVEEWTSSRYAPYPGGRYVADDLTAHGGRDYRILRGGSFARSGDLARCARRHGPHPDPPFRHRGFRLARDAS
jgi:formylglycine-generating enzyme required for sulfatase activity